MTTTISPIAPSYEQRYGHERDEVPVKKEIKAKNNGRTVDAGMTNVRVVITRKKDETSTSFADRYRYRLLFINDEQNRQYVLRDPDGGVHTTDPMSEAEAGKRLPSNIRGAYPGPNAWTPKTEEFLFMMKNGYEFYDEWPHNKDESIQIGYTVKAPTKEGA